MTRLSRTDAGVLVATGALVGLAMVVGRHTQHLVLQGAGPLRHGLPGVRYLIPVALAVVAVWWLLRAARTWSFGRLLVASFGVSAGWALALAFTNGAAGIVDRITTG